jgi:O-methyltransferase domain
VLEAAATPGGCIHTVELPGGRGRLEVGAYEYGGIRGSGLAADPELEDRFGLRFHLADAVPPWLAAEAGRIHVGRGNVSEAFMLSASTTGDLERAFASIRLGELPALAGLAGPGRLLDVGGGAGSHAAALARAGPGLEATVLDPPEVEPVLRERHPEVAYVRGDLDRPRFGRPPTERWDAVLLANVLHDHPADRCQAVVPPPPACWPPAAPCSSTNGCWTRAATPRRPSPCSTS